MSTSTRVLKLPGDTSNPAASRGYAPPAAGFERADRRLRDLEGAATRAPYSAKSWVCGQAGPGQERRIHRCGRRRRGLTGTVRARTADTAVTGPAVAESALHVRACGRAKSQPMRGRADHAAPASRRAASPPSTRRVRRAGTHRSLASRSPSGTAEPATSAAMVGAVPAPRAGPAWHRDRSDLRRPRGARLGQSRQARSARWQAFREGMPQPAPAAPRTASADAETTPLAAPDLQSSPHRGRWTRSVLDRRQSGVRPLRRRRYEWRSGRRGHGAPTAARAVPSQVTR